jgi:hypothetical protein
VDDVSARLKQFTPTPPRSKVDPAEVDAAGARHGFTSREPSPAATRKRRKIAKEPSRDLSFRLGDSEFDRFVAFADKYRLTYQEAVVYLLRIAEEAGKA